MAQSPHPSGAVLRHRGFLWTSTTRSGVSSPKGPPGPGPAEMRMKSTFLVTTLLVLCLAGPAVAQRSLFDQPVQNAPAESAPTPAAPAPRPAAPEAPSPQAAAPEAEEPAAPKARRAKPRKPRGPARSLAVFNGSPQTLVGLEVSQDGRGVQLKKPLAPRKRTRLALPAFKACAVSVSATFEGQPQGAPSEVDICKDSSLNFRD